MESKKEQAVRLALDYAKEREDKGLLVVSGTDMDEMDWSGGDPETVYSIVSLYSDDENNMDDEWYESIEAALMEKYPRYF